MKKVPFYPNKKDDLHCYQATLRMILKYFLPERTFTFADLDDMTGFQKGYWTWPMRGALSLRALGFQVRDIEEFDYHRIATDPERYLIEYYGEQAGKEQIRFSDIPKCKRDAREFVKQIPIEYRIPDYTDIQDLLTQGYLIKCLVNSKILNRKKGYVGHFVVVFRCTDHSIYFHDPGIPPRKSRRVTKRVFEKAWGYPNERAKNIMAFKI
ncbi:hypothetical protein A2Z00_03170 [Candidatus Gottesmanbacteria bacterium RBG_13_45_10]|uniref:Peptidase C39-like domain-containing protein n=1 Tax=Candidatus Gottesmanbacteria bacterium RBG_13_45_10 TaxID=1798370 RepID=A0A1F5ZIR3_9BACT|nr:MAG: hypothetical protein A2Z00_03170 [Candidatus Gottesmanbacteria bacterium RBG_13_45_10]